MAIIFVLSFATYFTEQLQIWIQLIPLVVLTTFVLLQLLFAKRWPRRATLFGGDGSFLLWLFPLFTFLSSLDSKYDKAIQFWILNVAVMVLARLCTSRISLLELLEGFYWAGVICMVLLLGLAGGALMKSVDTMARFSDLGFHPNTLGFIFAGYFAVALWKVLTGGWFQKIIAGLLATCCLAIIFFASSRGSLAAVGGMLFCVGAFYCVRNLKFKTLAFLVVLLALTSWRLVQGSGFGDAADYTDTVLQLSSGERAVDSGMTGRLGHWEDVLARLSKGSWFYGNGVRASEGLPFAVDNGFLVLLYDMGIVPFLLVVGRFAVLLWRFGSRYAALGSELDLAWFLVLGIFLVNNIVERYLFGVGNPFSLVVFMLLVCPWGATAAKLREPRRDMRVITLDSGMSPASCG